MARTRRSVGSGGAGDRGGGDADVPDQGTRRSFDEFFSEFNLTDFERRELIFFLAAYRYRRTIELLL